jgi:hypothetical protein
MAGAQIENWSAARLFISYDVISRPNCENHFDEVMIWLFDGNVLMKISGKCLI